jgi:uncharacterized membrane protein YphA (DoxX/SURF4 family)
MNALLRLGKYFFAVPFIVFGLLHFMGAEAMAGMVPVPGGAIWVYVTGLAMLAAGVSMLIGKYDKLAALLLGVLMIVYVLSIHLPAVMGGDQMAMPGVLKDLSLAGGSWLYALHASKDHTGVKG